MMMIIILQLRVSHAVSMLLSHPKGFMCAGSSEIYIYFKHIDQDDAIWSIWSKSCNGRDICI